MSVQFGKWYFDGSPVDRAYFAGASELLTKYGPDGEGNYFLTNLGMLYRPFHTTMESTYERQPLVHSGGTALTWDGRLDNRDELIPEVGLSSHSAPTDAQIVLAAYERWKENCFAQFIGDWALVLWNPIEQTLLLARDFAGIRHLFYTRDNGSFTWSTALDPLVLLAKHTFQIDEEYIAGYLSTYPRTHLTPYSGLNAVCPGHYVKITRNRFSTHSYWTFDPSKSIRYHTDSQYEEHFRSVFLQSVQRRLRSSFPVLAELSGGMDSTSIVCVADLLMANGNIETPRLDTISYYDDSEPNWNERPYFSLIEAKRGRVGHHVDLSDRMGALEMPENASFLALPGYDKLAWNRARDISNFVQSSQSRILLSGLGGDEFLGGVPTPIPELQDLFFRLHWRQFARQLFQWSLARRRPLTHLWCETVEEFLPQVIRRRYKRPDIAPWLTRAFVAKYRETFWADSQRTRLIGSPPAFQSCITTLDHVRRQINCSHLSETGNYRMSYPCLDRDLLTFLFAIPREQLVRPNQRRSLMRRALANIVPQEIFARKRKAFISRQPLLMLEATLGRIEALVHSPLAARYRWIEANMVSAMISEAKAGRTEPLRSLRDLLMLELWFHMLGSRNLLSGYGPSRDANFSKWKIEQKTELVT